MLRVCRKRKAVESYKEDDSDNEIAEEECDDTTGAGDESDSAQEEENNKEKTTEDVSEEASDAVNDDDEANMEEIQEAADQEDIGQPCDRDMPEDDLHTPHEEVDNIDVTPRLPVKRKIKRRRMHHSDDCPKNPSRKLFGPPKRKKDNNKKHVRTPRHMKELSMKKKENFQNRDISEQGVWVKCENMECRKWRFIKSVTDPSILHPQWTCDMHPDEEFNSCDKPEEDYSELEFIHAGFTEGSIVWAKMQGYPWWPAMIETDPDTNDFMIHEGIDSDVTHYHCVFLDKTVSRSWVHAASVKKFEASGKPPGSLFMKRRDFSKQIVHARERAMEALKLSIKDRIQTYGFSKTFKGVWGSMTTTEEESSEHEMDDEDDVDDEVVGILGSLLSSEDMEELKSQTADIMPGAVEAVKEMGQKQKEKKKPKRKSSAGKEEAPKRKRLREKKKKQKKRKHKDDSSREKKPRKHKRHEEKQNRKEELLRRMTAEKEEDASKEKAGSGGDIGKSTDELKGAEASQSIKENGASASQQETRVGDHSSSIIAEKGKPANCEGNSGTPKSSHVNPEDENKSADQEDPSKVASPDESSGQKVSKDGATLEKSQEGEEKDNDGKSLNEVNEDEENELSDADEDDIAGEKTDQDQNVKDGEEDGVSLEDMDKGNDAKDVERDAAGSRNGDDEEKKKESKAEKEKKRKDREEKKRKLQEEKERKLKEKEEKLKEKEAKKLQKELAMKEKEEKKKRELEEKEEKKKEKELKKQQREQELKEKEEKRKEKEMKKQKDKEEKEQKKREREVKKAKKAATGVKKTKKETDDGSSKDNDENENKDQPPAKKPKFSAPKSKPKAFVASVQVTDNNAKDNIKKEEPKASDGANQDESNVIENKKVERENEAIEKESGVSKDGNSDKKVVPNIGGTKLKRKKFSVKKKDIPTPGEEPKEESAVDNKKASAEITSAKDKVLTDEKDKTVKNDTDQEKKDPPAKKKTGDLVREDDPVKDSKDKKEAAGEVIPKSLEKNKKSSDAELTEETMITDCQSKDTADQKVPTNEGDDDDDFLDLDWSEAPGQPASPVKKAASAVDEDSDPFEVIEE